MCVSFFVLELDSLSDSKYIFVGESLISYEFSWHSNILGYMPKEFGFANIVQIFLFFLSIFRLFLSTNRRIY